MNKEVVANLAAYGHNLDHGILEKDVIEDTKAFDSKLPFGELVRAEAFSFSRFARRLIFQLNLDLVDDASQVKIPQRSKVLQSFRRKFNAIHAATKGTDEARIEERSIHAVAIHNSTRRMANHARFVPREVLGSRRTKALGPGIDQSLCMRLSTSDKTNGRSEEGS